MKYKFSTLIKLIGLHKKVYCTFGEFCGVDDYKILYDIYLKNKKIELVDHICPVNIYIGFIPINFPKNSRNIIILNYGLNINIKIPDSTIICCRDKVTYNLLNKKYKNVRLINDICYYTQWNDASKLITKKDEATLPQIYLSIYNKIPYELNAGTNYVNSALYDYYFKLNSYVNFKPNLVHYTYILLRRDPKRERNVYINCSKLCSFSIFDAIDGRTNEIEKNFEKHQIKVDFTKNKKKKSLLRSQYGCFFSHYNLWNYISTNGSTHNIILEDDVFIPPKHKVLLNNIINELGTNYEYCHLLRANGTSIGSKIKGKNYITNAKKFGNLAGYMITTHGAKVLLNNYKILRTQVDHQIGILSKSKKLKTLGTTNNVFYIPGILPSNIGRNGIRKKNKVYEPINYNIHV